MDDLGERAGWTRTVRAALCVLLAAAAAPIDPVSAMRDRAVRAPAPPAAIDFASITTRMAASKLVRKRLLAKIYIVPLELGGSKSPANSGYVTPEAAASHALLAASVAAYVQRDRLDHLRIDPEYRGLSIIPSRLRILIEHRGTKERYRRVIDVWGCAPCLPFVPLPDPDAPTHTA